MRESQCKNDHLKFSRNYQVNTNNNQINNKDSDFIDYIKSEIKLLDSYTPTPTITSSTSLHQFSRSNTLRNKNDNTKKVTFRNYNYNLREEYPFTNSDRNSIVSNKTYKILNTKRNDESQCNICTNNNNNNNSNYSNQKLSDHIEFKPSLYISNPSFLNASTSTDSCSNSPFSVTSSSSSSPLFTNESYTTTNTSIISSTNVSTQSITKQTSSQAHSKTLESVSEAFALDTSANNNNNNNRSNSRGSIRITSKSDENNKKINTFKQASPPLSSISMNKQAEINDDEENHESNDLKIKVKSKFFSSSLLYSC